MILIDPYARLNPIHKSFGSVNAVQDLSFRVKEGELFAFLGVNGAGKSTTINIMCGQLSKDKDVDFIKCELGVVFESSVLDSALYWIKHGILIDFTCGTGSLLSAG